MKYKIIRDKDYLHRKTTPVKTIEEGEEIAKLLEEFLDDTKVGIGLSAIQIGIPKSVSIVRVKKDRPTIVLMNPVITDFGKDKIIFTEGCLSLPGKIVNTIRSQKVVVSTLNHANPIPFGSDTDIVTSESIGTDTGLLECVCVQHEIDHTNGVLITDDSVKYTIPTKKVVKHGRNDKVIIEKAGETQYIKYKKAIELLSQGWKLI